MSFRRYEILLPIRYNDGTLVEATNFTLTRRELEARFGALTTHPGLFEGAWTHEDQTFRDHSLRLIVDTEATTGTREFFARFKELLKARFRQIDIWIISYEIEIH